ncbi:putative C-S lyase [Lactobacillus sp. DCY120]|uniref:cysteine-S-conjugate beta-lyase n=1 Tax=Bombilactobacillus apium TaxID=2675299 RepID=A0A850QZJ5_9LACO|nr:PatB family C-S lyase [Bombilactobacillus apium]NVY96113.1 putative C-S lyase [Bombilactobacillus apium]
MMYDFQKAPARWQTDSVKWDIKPGELPLWIADMDFFTAPEIIAALQKKLELGAFGYETPHQDYFQAVAEWYTREHQSRPQIDWFLFATGVIPALSAIVRHLTQAGDQILVQAPVYNIFYHSIENNGRRSVVNELYYQAGEYQIDWADLATKLADPLTTMMILCNPHNPVGKVWTSIEIQKIAQLCQDNQVILVADEIHGDLVWAGPDYTPTFSLPEKLRRSTITLVSPSKTFNLAALHAATVIVPDPDLRARVEQGLNLAEVAEPNLLALPGTIAAYSQGQNWLAELKQQLRANYTQAIEFIKQELPTIRVVSSRATYLLWLDVQVLTSSATDLATHLRTETGLILNAGTVYRGNGKHFLRLNFACPPEMLADGLQRLRQGISTYQAK